eukprot:gene13740-4661_t
MTRLRLLLWITVLISLSAILMHLFYIKNFNVKEAAIHIVQSLKIDFNKDPKAFQVDPHGNFNRNQKVEDVVPEVVKVSKESPKEEPSSSSSSNLAEKTGAVEQIQKPTKPEEKTTEIAKETKVSTNSITQCPKDGKQLVGAMAIDQRIPEMEDIIKEYAISESGWVEKGGKWKPKDCIARAKVALIIPFRKRERQLKIFLKHMHPVLHRQNLHYQIFVVEQAGTDPFNRAGLFNIGFTEALKADDFDCFVFSDVDLLPEDDRNSYGCPSSPRHMSVAIDKFNYRLPYESIFGGVGAFKKADFQKVNGFSNFFWGWGGEDDDLFARIRAKGFHLTRPPMTIGRYTMVRIHHFQSHGADPNRYSSTLFLTSLRKCPKHNSTVKAATLGKCFSIHATQAFWNLFFLILA